MYLSDVLLTFVLLLAAVDTFIRPFTVLEAACALNKLLPTFEAAGCVPMRLLDTLLFYKQVPRLVDRFLYISQSLRLTGNCGALIKSFSLLEAAAACS